MGAPFNNKAGVEMAKWKKKMAAYKKTRKYKEFQALKKANKLAKKPKDKNQPKKPQTAYFSFSNEVRPQVQAELGTTDFGPVGKKIGEMWKNMDASARAKYEAKNEKAKAKYAKDLAKYQTTKKYAEFQATLADWKQQVKEQKKAMKEQEAQEALVAPKKKVVRRRK